MLALTGQVKDKVGRVVQQGNILADPHRWDGGHAGKWRNDWGQDASQLKQTTAKLDELERRAHQVVEDIFKADSGTGAVAGGGQGHQSLWQKLGYYAAYIPLEAASSAMYGMYYGAYQALRYWNKLPAPLRIALTPITFPAEASLVTMEGIGLGGDIGIDLVKNAVLHNGESWKDEGFVGPLFGNGLKKLGFDPVEVYLPGVHANGAIDWEW
jgi:hypothetical protein